ncbi:hypothetical protein FMV2238Y02_04070 [Streptococcus canis]|uniref:DUF3862 domain-containing protein n=1 Tax=Streptococcus canis TaxID=1329 RepID=A0A3P5XNK3_STRCB|nr:DUF3862 domain-containing protein [Streptococcus canis]VDC41984.1 hypothetical protein FMV2238Y02_04070 [Streptococcus canis]
MTKQTAFSLLVLPLLALFLSACSPKKEKKVQQSKDTTTLTETRKADHQEVRAHFEKIKLATAASEFKGGSNLEDLTALFGQPSHHEEKLAGSVTLDAYTWNFDQVTLNVNLYQNSSIVKTISNFAFIRDLNSSQKDYQKLQKGMSYDHVKQILTEPDNYSQAFSSDKQILQATWISGLKTETNGANISLVFENNQLTEMSQVGLGE